MLQVLYEDDEILVVWKPAGIDSQSSRGLTADMVSEIKRHIHRLSPMQEEPYVGVIHRLDKPVSGIMVYAKEKKAAAQLSLQLSEGKMEKRYLAVLCGKPVDNVENFVDYLLKDEKSKGSRIVDKGISGAKRAELVCRVVGERQEEPWGQLTLAEIELKTGRYHQIRVQMAGHGLPIWGDSLYNPMFGGTWDVWGGKTEKADQAEKMEKGEKAFPAFRGGIALSAFRLSFIHPRTGRRLSFERLPDDERFRNFSSKPSR